MKNQLQSMSESSRFVDYAISLDREASIKGRELEKPTTFQGHQLPQLFLIESACDFLTVSSPSPLLTMSSMMFR